MLSFRSGLSQLLCLSLLAVAPVTGCGSGDDDDTGDSQPNSNAGQGGDGSSGKGSNDNGTCTESTLFEPMKFGDDGDEVIGEVQPDTASGDIFFATNNQLWVVRKGKHEAEMVAERPTDIWSDFWLSDDGFLFPSGFQIPLVDEEIAVLYAMPRSGGEPMVQVAAPVSADLGWSYNISSVVVVGDEVVWIARDGFTDNPSRLPPEYDNTYYVRKTNWKKPGKPEVLYESKMELSGLVIAGDTAYVAEAQDDSIGAKTDQRIIPLDGSGADAMTTQERYGAEVVAGSPDSMLVTTLDTADWGSFWMSLDGSKKEKLGDVLILSIGDVPAASRDGRWVMLQATDDIDKQNVVVFEPGKGVRTIGCIDSDYQGGVALTSSEALVAIEHDEAGSTVLRFPL